MRSSRSDVSWFLRAARIAPVVAGAAFLGGMIGGFAMFAIDSALTWEPATESVSQPRPDARADSQASAAVAQTKPVRIVGGAIPDPSAGMSAPPPAPQQRSAAAPAQSPAQLSPRLLAPKPLGPASRLQSQTATAGPASGAPQQQNQITNQPPVPAQAATVTQQPTNHRPTTQQPTRWPDALSGAHQNAANAANANDAQQPNANGAQQQSAPPPSSDRAASADDQDRASASRRGRHSRRHWRGDDDNSASASSSRRQDARTYDRLYDSNGNRRDRSYSNTREQFYGDTRGDQDDAASRSDFSRSEMRRSGRGARYQRRWQAQDNGRDPAIEAGRSRPESFWGGGGFFRRGNGYQDDD